MSQGTEKTRLALAAFDGANDLRLALADLAKLGVAREQIGIAVLASSVPQVAAAERSSITDFLGDTETVQTGIADQPLIMTSDSLWQHISVFGRAGVSDSIAASWMPRSLRTLLTDQIRSGAFILGVSADGVEQQRQSTRILLNRSSHRVQTHEFNANA